MKRRIDGKPIQMKLSTSLFSTVTAFCGVILSAGTIHAATLTTGFNVRDFGQIRCDNVETTGSTTTCRASDTRTGHVADVILQTRAENGNIGLRADLKMSATGEEYKIGTLFQARVGVTFEDTLTFTGIDDGLFIVPLDLAGSSFAPAPSSSSEFVGVSGISSTDIQIDQVFKTSSGGFDGNTLFREQRTGTTLRNDPADNTVTFSTGSTGVQNVLFPIINGKSEFSISMGAGVSCNGLFTTANPCNASVDFLNSARFLGASVQDLNGNDISGVSIFSNSGFDYLTGVQPHNVAPVPLPASGLMLIVGLMGLTATARRR